MKSNNWGSPLARILLLVVVSLLGLGIGCSKPAPPTAKGSDSRPAFKFGEGGESVAGKITFQGRPVPLGVVVFFSNVRGAARNFGFGDISQGEYKADHIPQGEVTITVLTDPRDIDEIQMRGELAKVDRDSAAKREEIMARYRHAGNGGSQHSPGFEIKRPPAGASGSAAMPDNLPPAMAFSWKRAFLPKEDQVLLDRIGEQYDLKHHSDSTLTIDPDQGMLDIDLPGPSESEQNP